jgi:hypothetical protein
MHVQVIEYFRKELRRAKWGCLAAVTDSAQNSSSDSGTPTVTALEIRLELGPFAFNYAGNHPFSLWSACDLPLDIIKTVLENALPTTEQLRTILE